MPYLSDDPNVETRYYELRYDGERMLSGVAMPYGEVAELPWGDKERFQQGAFGDLAQLDVILNRQHQRTEPLARTTGGDLSLSDSQNALRISAQLPNTQEANDTLELVRTKVLRGFSVEFMPEETRNEKGVTVIEKAKLVGVAVVDRPAYSQAMIDARSKRNQDMNEEQIRALIEQAIESRSDDGEQLDVEALATALNEGVKAEVRSQIEAVLQERDEAQEAQQRAEQDAKNAETAIAAERKQMEQDAEERAELIVMLRSLLSKDTETRGKSKHELLVLAAGDEIPNASERSEDYLLAKLEDIIARRADVAESRTERSKQIQVPTLRMGPVTPVASSPLTDVTKLAGRPTPGMVRGIAKN